METWKPIPGYERLYQASSTGKIKSLRSGNELSPYRLKRYLRVSLTTDDGRNEHLLVHRLVLAAFTGFFGRECIHKDCDPTNNNRSNLKWGTHKENMAMDAGHNHSFKGSDNRNSKLSMEQVCAVRSAYDSRINVFWGRKHLAKRFGISEHQLTNIAKRKPGGWAHI